jgi:hypothetical protein
MLGIHHETVKYILRNNLNTCMVNFKWVLCMLENCPQTVQVEVS